MQIFSAIVLMLVLGGLIGLALGIASKKLYVESDTRVDDVLAMLPGYNCGGCGNPGCSGMAEKIVDGTGTVNQCKPCKADMKEAILKYVAENCGN